MNPEKRAWIELHFAVLCFGFTAILGAWITLTALVLVWWRVGITSLSLVALLRGVGGLAHLPRKLLWQYAGIGILVALHWLTFYGAVKLANASITLICMATASLFTAFLEPWIVGRRLLRIEVLLGLMVIPGMALVVTTIDPSHGWGLVAGLASAALAALFSILNKKLIHRADPLEITLLELSSAFGFLTVVIGAMALTGHLPRLQPSPGDWVHLLILSLVCTTLAYVLSLRALRHLSAFASNLTINLEPVYGIVLAILLLGEHRELSLSFYAGVALILGAVLSYPWLKKRWAV
jgi:drug/metabolite transporter (DMT)-like permease